MTTTRPTASLLRALSDEAVVRAVLEAGRATRAELATTTGLSKPTVTESVRRLVAKGLVYDTGERTTGRGGVGTYYAPGEAIGTAMAVAIAPEGVLVELVDAVGSPVARVERSVARPAAPATVRRAFSAAARAAVRDLPGGAADLAVVSAADPVDRATGRLVHLPDAPFLVGDLDPGAVLAPMVRGPVIVDNDVNWAARHERDVRGTGSRLDDFAYLYLGEGLGCAIVSDGEVRRGHAGLAGEVAHAVTSGPDGKAMPFTTVFDRLGLHRPGSASIDVARLVEAAKKQRVLRSIATATAGVIAALVTLTDPELVVLGGPWGTDERIAEAVSDAVAASARPVALDCARARADASLAGARADAVHRLREAISARSRAG